MKTIRSVFSNHKLPGVLLGTSLILNFAIFLLVEVGTVNAAADPAWGETPTNFVQADWSGVANGSSLATQTGWTNFTSETSFMNSGTDLQITSSGTLVMNITTDSVDAPVVGVSQGGFKYTHPTLGGLEYTDTTQVIGTGASASVANEYTTQGSEKVVAGGNHTCAMNHNRLYCWGGNDRGQLGNGSYDDTFAPTLVAAGNCATQGCTSAYLEDIVDVSAGDKVTCAISNNPVAGTIYCWGLNEQGQLGIGTFAGWSPTPRIITRDNSGGPMAGFIKVSVGDDSVCALRSTGGRVWCWGNNGAGQLGIGANGDRAYPTPVVRGDCPVGMCPTAQLTGVSMISTGDKHSCAIKSGYLFCWGGGQVGQLGDGTTANSRDPVRVRKGSCVVALNPLCTDAQYINNVVDISAGNQHSCAIVASAVGALGATYCWGADKFGELGQGSQYGNQNTPQDVIYPGTTQITNRDTRQVSAGKHHSCAIYGSPTAYVYCWGAGGYGQLGNGSQLNVDGPVATSPLLSATQIASSFGNDNGGHTCALTTTYIYCWGANNKYQLGGSSNPNESNPTQARSDWVTEGYYESGILFSSSVPNWQDFFWNQTIPTLSQFLILQVRTSADGNFSTVPWTGCPSYQYHVSGTTSSAFTPFTGCVTSGHQYIQYRARLIGVISNSPLLNSIGFRYGSYNASGQLVSSVYDTGNSQIVIDSLSWSQTLPTGTAVIVDLRSASSQAGVLTATYKPFSSLTAGCSGSSTITCGDTALTTGSPNFQDRVNDRFVQYRVRLTGTGLTPTFDNLTIGYFVPRGKLVVELYDQNGAVVSPATTNFYFGNTPAGPSGSCASPITNSNSWGPQNSDIGSYTATGCTTTNYIWDSIPSTLNVSYHATTTLRLNYTHVTTLTIVRAGTGTGTVTSNPVGINCGTTCTYSFNYGTTVVLTEAPAVSSNFTSWSGGGCSGSGSTCSVTLNSNSITVTATFTLRTFTVQVLKNGTGTGTVIGSAAPIINCGATCSRTYNYGTSTVLTATPSAGSVFTSWSGSCTASGNTCTIASLTANTTITATFTRVYTLTINKSGNGTVTSTSPASPVINCGGTCNQTFNQGTVVTLVATPPGDWGFTGWSGGGCSGTGTCVVTMTANTTVTAPFYQLNQPPSGIIFDTPLPRSLVIGKEYIVRAHGLDPDGDDLTCTWSMAAATGTYTLTPNGGICNSSSDPAQVRFTATSSGQFQIRVAVDDGLETIEDETPDSPARTLPSWVESKP